MHSGRPVTKASCWAALAPRRSDQSAALSLRWCPGCITHSPKESRMSHPAARKRSACAVLTPVPQCWLKISHTPQAVTKAPRARCALAFGLPQASLLRGVLQTSLCPHLLARCLHPCPHSLWHASHSLVNERIGPVDSSHLFCFRVAAPVWRAGHVIGGALIREVCAARMRGGVQSQ